MPKITQQISWVYTEDLDASGQFYRDILGLDCVRDEGGARVYATASGARIGVCRIFEDRVVEPRGCMISLVTDEIDDCYREMLERGLEIDAPPRRLEQFGIKSFFVRDPNGYTIEFQQFDSKSG